MVTKFFIGILIAMIFNHEGSDILKYDTERQVAHPNKSLKITGFSTTD